MQQSATLSPARALERAREILTDLKAMTSHPTLDMESVKSWGQRIFDESDRALKCVNDLASTYCTIPARVDLTAGFVIIFHADIRRMYDTAIRLQQSHNIRRAVHIGTAINTDMQYVASMIFKQNYWGVNDNNDVIAKIVDKFRGKILNSVAYYVAYADGNTVLSRLTSDVKPELFIGCFATCIFNDNGDPIVVGAISDEAAYAKLCSKICDGDTKNARVYTIAYVA